MATFYAIDSATDSVYGIDSLTGAARNIGELGLDSDFSGLFSPTAELSDEQPLIISNLTEPLGSEALATVDFKTGVATAIGPQSVGNIQAIAEQSGLLYGFSAAQGLGTLNAETGEFTALFDASTLPVAIAGADVDESTNSLFALGEDNALYTVDASTGEALPVGDTGVDFNGRAGLTYNPADEQLYALGDDATDGDNLYRIDKVTGAASLIGNTGLVETDALEFVPLVSTAPESPAPEPDLSTPDPFPSTPDNGDNAVPDQLIVKTRTEMPSADAEELLQSVNGTVEEMTQTLDIQLWEVDGISVEEAVDTLNDNPLVEYAEANSVVSITDIFPSDPRFDELYGLNNTGQTGGVPDADIDSPESWDIQTGSEDVVVGVIDTGVDYTHPDLDDNIWTNPGEIRDNGIDDDGNGYVDDFFGYDFFNNDGDPFDDNSHGTHVAGTIAAEGNNGVGVSGVSWDAQIMGLKFLGADGFGSTFDAIRAVEYATMMGADLTSNSWGGGGFSEGLQDAIAAAGEQGQLYIAAAGNNGSDNDLSPYYPASYDLDNIISVAATDDSDRLAGFSNFGNTFVDLGAPGVSTLSTVPGGGYGFKSGTSMATPHVSGVATLLLSQEPDLSPEEVKNLILTGVDLIESLDGKTATGGRLNAFNALSELGPPSEIIGTEGDDVLVGTEGRDSILGLGGDDIIQALGGDDQASGGDDNDLISGGDGNDTITGDGGRDDILGGNGNDEIDGGGGPDRILGESGDDTLTGGEGNDVIESGDGNDIAQGGLGSDRLFGGAGADSLSGDDGADSLTGGLGNDVLDGGGATDTLTGVDPTRPVADGGAGVGEVDTLTGGSGPDTFVLGDATQVYYDDGDPLTRGEADYALITDFNIAQDILQLNGSADLYSLDFFTSSLGTTDGVLFFDPGISARKEWIGTLQNISPTLSLDDAAFRFV